MDFDYKKYSLEKLNEWMHDAISCSEATPQEIYDVIKDVVSENYYTYKNETEKCYELLCLLNGNGKGHIDGIEDKNNPWYEYFAVDPRGNEVPIEDTILKCDKDDPSPECKDAWNSFWDVNESNAIEYNLREAEYYNKRAELDSIKKWVLPVESDGLTGDCGVTLPDDLLQQVGWKEGDKVEWVDNKNGTFTLRKS